jgi:hypothetical protein
VVHGSDDVTDTPDALAEREAIVAWMRKTWPAASYGDDWLPVLIANRIERAEHHKGKE